MKPIGPLMREHRLIELLIPLLRSELTRIGKNNRVDIELITFAVDFFRNYADKTHHGKEEDILFKKLAQKNLLQEHKTTMKELIEEHILGRKLVTALLDAKDIYLRDNTEGIQSTIRCITELINFYPTHIEKEDKYFFYPILDYLSEKEQEKMLLDFCEFDRKMIHEKYQHLVDELGMRFSVQKS